MCHTGPPRDDVDDLGRRCRRSISTRFPPRPAATRRRSCAAPSSSSRPVEAVHHTREVRTKPSVPGTRSTHCQSSTTLYSSTSPSSLPTATASPSGVGATAVMAAGVQSTNRARCRASLSASGGILASSCLAGLAATRSAPPVGRRVPFFMLHKAALPHEPPNRQGAGLDPYDECESAPLESRRLCCPGRQNGATLGCGVSTDESRC